MQLAFYRAASGTIYDRLVAFCSRPGIYSHVEMRFSDGQFFSSSPRDGGCRFKTIPLDYHWDAVEIPLSHVDEGSVRDFCRSLCRPRRYKYDWAGVFRFVFPSIPLKMSRHRRFCSEACMEALQSIGIFAASNPRKVSPNMLYRMVMYQNWESDEKKEAA